MSYNDGIKLDSSIRIFYDSFTQSDFSKKKKNYCMIVFVKEVQGFLSWTDVEPKSNCNDIIIKFIII